MVAPVAKSVALQNLGGAKTSRCVYVLKMLRFRKLRFRGNKGKRPMRLG